MNRDRSRRAGIMTALASFALVVLAACGTVATEVEQRDVTRVPIMSDAAAQATREAASGASPVAGGAAASPAATAASVTITAHDIFFDPKEVTIPANTNVKIVLPNQGAAAHNFSIDALKISVDLAPGETKDVVVNAPAGKYEFYCDVPGHKEAGMVGTLNVSAEAAAAPPAATPAAAAVATPVGAAPAAQAAGPVTITAQDIFFEPKEVTIPANTDVTVMLPNKGAAAHNFSIDALGISVDLPPGATEKTVINAPPGKYEYYCNVPGHKQAGMVGTLIVSAEAAAPGAAPAAAAASPAAASPAAGAGPAASAPVEIVAQDIFFEPKELTIPANTDVTMNLTNKGAAAHNFSIDALKVSVDLPPGATEHTVINAPPGTYEYYCNVPGHKQAGMVGKLIVSAAPATAGAAASPVSAPPAASPAATGAGAAAAAPVEIVAQDIFFDPKKLTIPANTDVAVSLPNKGVTSHNFSIDALNISVDIAPGATEHTVINAPPGTYQYYCNVPGHKEAGMVGTLTVQ